MQASPNPGVETANPPVAPASIPHAVDVASDASQPEPGETRTFTLRALGLGLLGTMLVAGYAYFNDYGIRQNYIVGNHLPLTIYSTFFLFLVLVNPVLVKASQSKRLTVGLAIGGWVLAAGAAALFKSALPLIAFGIFFGLTAALHRKPAWNPIRAFSRGEMVVMISMPLVAASLPTSGLMRNLPQILVMPQHYGKSITDWDNAEPTRYVTEINPNVFPERDKEGRVYEGYAQGIRRGKGLPPLKDTPFAEWFSKGITGVWDHFQQVPYGAWIGPMLVWFPPLIIGFVFFLSMCRVVHKQWSENEHLSYPIADFAHSLLQRQRHRVFGDVFYSKLFWIAFGTLMFVHIINGWSTYDARMIKIPVSWNLGQIYNSSFTFMHHASGHPYLLYGGKLFFAVIAFAYFLPEEISLSLGLSLPLFMIVTAASYGLGHPVTGEEHNFLIFGAFVAMAGVIFYTGRHYYGVVLRRALFFKTSDEMDSGTIWACRWFLISAVAFVFFLKSIGLDLLLSVMAVAIIGIVFLVLARVSAETGTPFMQSHIMANKVIFAILGPAALGPAAMYILQLIGTAFMQDNRECLTPYVINGYRLGSRNGVEPAPMSRAMLLALVIGLFAAGAATLWVIYDYGAQRDGYMGANVPTGFAKEISREIQKLKRTGKLEESMAVSGLDRFTSGLRDTHNSFVTFFLIGLGLVLVNSALRLRYLWWPIHSVLFLFWGTWAISNFIWSFLLGWLIKVCVVRIGGGSVYQDLKPLFIGVIVGDLLGGMFWIIFGLLWYFWLGESPKNYGVFPG